MIHKDHMINEKSFDVSEPALNDRNEQLTAQQVAICLPGKEYP